MTNAVLTATIRGFSCNHIRVRAVASEDLVAQCLNDALKVFLAISSESFQTCRFHPLSISDKLDERATDAPREAVEYVRVAYGVIREVPDPPLVVRQSEFFDHRGMLGRARSVSIVPLIGRLIEGRREIARGRALLVLRDLEKRFSTQTMRDTDHFGPETLPEI